jgi:hypothetical protein
MTLTASPLAVPSSHPTTNYILPSQFKIIRNVRIHPKFLQQHRNITQATLHLDECIALFCDFSSSHCDLHLTAIFNAGRTSSFLNPETVTSTSDVAEW